MAPARQTSCRERLQSDIGLTTPIG